MHKTSRLLSRLVRLLAPVMVVIILVVGAAVAHAQAPIKLGLRTVGEAGAYFDVTMAPGERRELRVQLSNGGTETVRARTFSSDAYSLVNGGFGSRLDGQPTGGTTGWLGYSTEALDLAPGTNIERTFSVSVPADAKPGEYLTSLVLQNADPTSGDGAQAGGVVIKQVVRQALAVAITIPGPLTPSFQLGAVTQKSIGDRTTVAVQVQNTGNVRLKPAGEFILMDISGKELSRYPITMGTVYAGTTTTAEMPFDQRLNPGDYTVSASLTDASGATAAPGPLALNVPQPVAPDATVANAGPGRATIDQAPLTAPAVGSQAADSGGNSGLLFVGLGAISLGLILGLGFLFLQRRRRPTV
jgi:hypothetical protein